MNGHIGCYANYLVVWLSLRGFSFAWKYRESKKKMLSILFCYRSDPCLQIFSTRMWTFQVVCTELTGRSDLSTASWRTLTCNSETADCNPVSEKALKFLSRNQCQSHLCYFYFFYFFCESTSAWLLFITILSSTSLVLSSLQSVANTQIKSLCGFMNPFREMDSEGVLKGAGRRHRPHFSEGGQGQGLFFVSHEYSLVAV